MVLWPVLACDFRPPFTAGTTIACTTIERLMNRDRTVGHFVGGSALVAVGAVWIVTLLVTGFSALVVSVGLLTALYLLNGTDRVA